MKGIAGAAGSAQLDRLGHQAAAGDRFFDKLEQLGHLEGY